ncbi:TP901 family phage tail tape measure protein [Sphingomonas sp. PP-CE-1A-559]|uniref:phage tail tape measure protein n=1 Tax=Sphingomonas sp. PP-CE-1A-559 TaxID=2135657 RepID=UPI0010556D92|nr:phage tail tape measure protein [Sphingomonas sp. PP-CE-1A-559]TCP92744.1 TP901 family phage tail tape measure protein [Sphingomonas sp. PP-CE-1A-559]
MADATATIRIDVNTSGGEANVRRLNQELNGLTRSAASGRAANDNYNNSINRAAGGMGRAAGQGNLLSRSIDDIRQRAAGTIPILGTMADRLGGISTKAAAAGAAITVAVGAMVQATSAANKYADVLAKISTNVNTSKFNMKELSDGILAQSAVFGGMPVDQAEAAYDIISAGADSASQALDILNASNGLAVGGITKVGVAADGLTSILNSYAGKGLTAAAASDAMFISARDGKTTIEKLSSEVGKVAPLAATMGVSFDEVAGALAVLTKGGINTSESVTGVRAILSAITKPSDEAKKAAKGLGLEFNVAALQAKGLRGVLQDMADKTGGSTSKMAVLLGGVEALVPALALTSNKGNEFAATMDHMATKAGATKAAVDKMLEGSPAAQWARVTASANAELVKLGSTASTFAAPAFKFLADNLGTIVTLIEVAVIPLSLRMVAIWGTAAVQAITTLAATAAMRFASMAAAQGVLAASTATMSAGFSGLLSMFGGPLGIAIGAAAYGIYTLASNSSSANAEIERLAASAGNTASQASNTNVQSLQAARGVSTFGGQAGKAAEQLWNMAAAAKAAAVQTARLQLTKSLGTFREVNDLTDRGFGRAQARDQRTVTDPNASIGERAGAIGSQVQRGWNKLWAPRQEVVVAARNRAMGDVRAAQAALAAAQGSKEESFLPKPVATDKPFADKPDSKKDKGADEAARRLKQETEFWQKLNDEVYAAKLFGIEQQKITKEQELQKLLARDLSAAEKQRVDTAVIDLANAKAVTDLKQSAFELTNKNLLLQQRAIGLSDEEVAVQDALDSRKLAALNAGVNLQDAAYQAELKNYEAVVRTNVQREKRNELLKQANDIAKRYSTAFASQTDMAQLEKERLAVVEAYAKGGLKDALGQNVTKTIVDSIIAGFDAAAVEIRNRPLEVVANYTGDSSYAAQVGAINKENANYASAKAAVAASGLDAESQKRLSADVERAHALGMTKATRTVANKFVDDMTAGISELADLFGGAMGEVLNGFSQAIKSIQGNANGTSGLSQMFTSFSSKLGEGFKNGNASMLDVGKGLKNLGNPLGDLKKSFDPAAGGGALKGIGTAVGGAMAGLQIGEKIGQLGKALGLKGSETGAKIGGAIGGLTGNPLIAAAASAVGGLISSMLYKPKYGTASITGGSASSVSVTGNKSSMKDNASGAAGSVQAGLADIAAKLGGAVGSFSVAIGQYDGKWRVRDDAYSGKLKFKGAAQNGLHDFGKDGAEEAIAYAIQNAIQDGAITGIAGFISKALKDAGAEFAVSLMNAVKDINSELDGMLDPMGASVREVIDPVNELITQMKKYGATSTDVAKLEQYKTEKMKQLLKEQTANFRSILDDLNGSTGGFTALTQLTGEMDQLKKYQGDLAAGKTVDQGEYGSLIDKIMSNAQSVYGTNSMDYQKIVGQVRDVTTSAITAVTNAINSASGNSLADPTSAITAQTDTLASLQGVANDYAAQQVEIMTEMRDSIRDLKSGNGVYAYNGRLAVAY